MSSYHVEELIWHFMGYMHMAQFHGRALIDYQGAYTPADDTYDAGRPNPGFTQPVRVSAEGAAADDISTPFSQYLTGRDLPPEFLDNMLRATPPVQDLITVPHDDGAFSGIGGGGGGLQGPRVTIHFRYAYGENEGHVFQINQSNGLTDNDRLTVENEYLTIYPDIDIEETLNDLIEQAQELGFEIHPAVAAMNHKEIADMVADNSAGIKADGADFETGYFFNGEKGDREEELEEELEPGVTQTQDGNTFSQITQTVPPDSEEDASTETQSAGDDGASGDTGTAEDASEPDDGGDDAPEPVVTEFGPQVVTAEYDGPTGGAAQIAELGANNATNLAFISDVTEGYGGIVVKGDVFQTDIIMQLNILHDNDSIELSPGSTEAVVNQADNETENHAEFFQENNVVFGNAAYGGGPGLTWNVSYIEGDFWDVKSFVQVNEIHDNDITVQTSVNTHYVAVTGENTQLNYSGLFDLGEIYDVIIVGGNLYEHNEIWQTNILLDNDYVHSAGSAEYGVGQSVETNGNTLINDAQIYNYGGQGFRAFDQNAHDLVNAIDDEAASVDVDLAFALEIDGNGTPELNVLYITGDYFDYKGIHQINVVADVDAAAQYAVYPEGADPDGLEQSVDAGGNVLLNTAVIVDIDSTSDFQYVGGTFYADTTLVQADIISDDDTLTFDNVLPDIDEVTAAVVIASETEISIGDQQTETTVSAGLSGDDIMSSVLA